MERLTKSKLEKILADGLGLTDAVFHVEKYGGTKMSGHLVSAKFRRMTHHTRHRRIRDSLEAALGADEVDKQVGMIFTHTPEDWQCYLDMKEDEEPTRRKRKTG